MIGRQVKIDSLRFYDKIQPLESMIESIIKCEATFEYNSDTEKIQ